MNNCVNTLFPRKLVKIIIYASRFGRQILVIMLFSKDSYELQIPSSYFLIKN